jgi:hypothetical protein
MLHLGEKLADGSIAMDAEMMPNIPFNLPLFVRMFEPRDSLEKQG